MVEYEPPTPNEGPDLVSSQHFAVGRDCDIFVRPREGGLAYSLKEIVEVDYELDGSGGRATLKIGFYGHGKGGADASLRVVVPAMHIPVPLRSVSEAQPLTGLSSAVTEYMELRITGWASPTGQVKTSLVRIDPSGETPVQGFIHGSWKPWSGVDFATSLCSNTDDSAAPKVTLDTSKPGAVLKAEYLDRCFEFGLMTSHGLAGG